MADMNQYLVEEHLVACFWVHETSHWADNAASDDNVPAKILEANSMQSNPLGLGEMSICFWQYERQSLK
jgi:hypothetical protein